jgi:hypothetical protein
MYGRGILFFGGNYEGNYTEGRKFKQILSNG